MMELEGILHSLLEDRILAYIVGALVAAVVLLFLAIRLWAGAGSSDDEKQLLRYGSGQAWPFFPKRPLTEPEQALYHRLVKALPEHIILAQVQLSQLLGVRKGHNFQEWYNRINRLSADFVVCARDATVIAVIELDDGNRDRGDRQASDQRKSKALNAAGIRLLRWQTWGLPDEAEIRRCVFTTDTTPQRHESLEKPLRATH